MSGQLENVFRDNGVDREAMERICTAVWMVYLKGLGMEVVDVCSFWSGPVFTEVWSANGPW